jgi:osmotically-inducible protein OsmY
MRALARLMLTLILLAASAIAGYYYGYRAASGQSPFAARQGTRTEGGAIAEQARREGSTIGKKLSEAGSEATEFLSDAALTTKIKAKMGLDDYVPAAAVHVSTTNAVVTLSGTVSSDEERRRALQLARETKGVKSVVDQLKVEPRQ